MSRSAHLALADPRRSGLVLVSLRSAACMMTSESAPYSIAISLLQFLYLSNVESCRLYLKQTRPSEMSSQKTTNVSHYNYRSRIGMTMRNEPNESLQPPNLLLVSVAIAILGGYAGLVVLFKIKSAISGPKKVEA